MRDMTTAEFAKANLAALEEPVEVRRYTKVVGIYYPAGYVPAEPDAAALRLQLDAIDSISPPDVVIAEKDEEIARLKRELAKRPAPEAVARLQAPARGNDPFAGLAKQDRDFFDRKLGSKKK